MCGRFREMSHTFPTPSLTFLAHVHTFPAYVCKNAQIVVFHHYQPYRGDASRRPQRDPKGSRINPKKAKWIPMLSHREPRAPQCHPKEARHTKNICPSSRATAENIEFFMTFRGWSMALLTHIEMTRQVRMSQKLWFPIRLAQSPAQKIMVMLVIIQAQIEHITFRCQNVIPMCRARVVVRSCPLEVVLDGCTKHWENKTKPLVEVSAASFVYSNTHILRSTAADSNAHRASLLPTNEVAIKQWETWRSYWVARVS